MRRAEIWAVGRLRQPGLRELCDDYLRRCSSLLKISDREFKDNASLFAALPPRCLLVLLDERGTQATSIAFSHQLSSWMGQDTSLLVFAIGAADGFSAAQRQRADALMALGPMTLAHQLARVVLAEQLYRAVSIIEGAPYHRS